MYYYINFNFSFYVKRIYEYWCRYQFFIFHFVRESSKILINVQKQNRLNTKTLEILAWQRSIVQLYLFRLYWIAYFDFWKVTIIIYGKYIFYVKI